MEKIGESHPQLQILEDCFVVEGNGLGFVDVLSTYKNELFEPGQLPGSILEDQIIGPGYETMATLSQAGLLTVHVVESAHGSKTHFMEAYQQNLAPLLPDVEHIGVEINWHLENGEPKLDTDKLHPGRGQGFQPAQVDKLIKRNKNILPLEYGNHEDTPISQHINTLFNLYLWAQKAQLNAEERKDICTRATLAWQIYRQKTMLGRLGAWLNTLKDTGQLSEGHNDVIAHIGAGHSPIASLLNEQGIDAVLHSTEHTDFPATEQQAQWIKAFKQVMSTSYVTNEQLTILKS